ncbi:MAG: DUF2065 domain-containing protein [bacterium]
MRYLLSVLSMVLIIEGIPYFMFPRKFKELIRMVLEIEESYLRIAGLGLMLVGLTLLYLTMG